MIAAAVTLGIGVFERRWTHREPIDAPLSRRTSNLPMLAVATASLAAATQLVGNIHGPGMLIASFLLLGLAVFLCVVVGLRSLKFLRTRRSPTDA